MWLVATTLEDANKELFHFQGKFYKTVLSSIHSLPSYKKPHLFEVHAIQLSHCFSNFKVNKNHQGSS